jgi:predicted dehydrogenase
MEPVRIGVVGVGNISGIYFDNLKKLEGVEVVAVADLDVARAEAVAAERGIARALTTEALLADSEVEFVLNLTIPAAHGPVALQAIENGKHVYNEKPLSVSRAEAQQVIEAASKKGLRVGCAPDTFLGAGLQTARKSIDAGDIGEPIGAQARMIGHGPEAWHPNPDFFYKNGGGPMLDMGPYYVTALVHLLGPVARVSGSARISQKRRPIVATNEAFYGQARNASLEKGSYEIEVETPTHYAGVLDFAGGAISELTMSFDVWHSKHDWQHPIIIFGTEGSMLVPDPNNFGGTVLVRKAQDSDWHEVPVTHGNAENSRGVGVQDMALAIRNGGAHRVSGALAFHVLDVMLSVREAGEQGLYKTLTSGVERPAPL